MMKGWAWERSRGQRIMEAFHRDHESDVVWTEYWKTCHVGFMGDRSFQSNA